MDATMVYDLTDSQKQAIDNGNRELLAEFRDKYDVHYGNSEVIVLDVRNGEFDGIAEDVDAEYGDVVAWMHDRSPVAPEYGTPLVIPKQP